MKKTSVLHTDPHNALFKGIITHKEYNLELLRLSLPSELFVAFDWETLRSEACTYINKEGQERRTDLILSAKFKDSKGAAKVIFVVEHKAQKAPREVLLQLLEYQNVIYQNTQGPLTPIIPIIVYQGEVKTWSGPIKLYDILEYPEGKMGELLKRFVLDFECCLLNVHDLKVEKNKDLILGPIWYIMQSIFSLDEDVLKKLFAQGKHLPDNEWERQIVMAIKYIQRVDPSFNWEIIREVAKEEKGEETMALLDKTIDQMVIEGVEKGREEGREEGMEKGLEKGERKKAREIAKTLLASGMTPEFVSQSTGLSLQEVKKLIKEQA